MAKLYTQCNIHLVEETLENKAYKTKVQEAYTVFGCKRGLLIGYSCCHEQ